MRSKFPGYYRKLDEHLEQLVEHCVFVFDTNVLLHLYSLSEASRDEFIDVLKQVQDRIWIPHQVALEFHKNRLKAIDDARNAPISQQAEIRKLKTSFLSYLNTHDRYAASDEPAKLREVVADAFDGLLGVADRVSERVRDTFGEVGTYEVDPVLDRVTELFDDSRVGDPFSTRDRTAYTKEAQRRIDEKIPPGYDDHQKQLPERYGDYFIWAQTLDKAQSLPQTPIIFVTEEQKGDWWWKRSNAVIGPRPELVTEMLDVAETEFHMYRASRFLYFARQWLDSHVSEHTIEEFNFNSPIFPMRPPDYSEFLEEWQRSLPNPEMLAGVPLLSQQRFSMSPDLNVDVWRGISESSQNQRDIQRAIELTSDPYALGFQHGLARSLHRDSDHAAVERVDDRANESWSSGRDIQNDLRDDPES